MPNFIPLHIKSGYSFLSSGILLDKLFAKAKEEKYTCLGLSDFEVMYGLPKFNALAKKYDIKPVFGMDLVCESYYLSLYVKNEEGYKNLCLLTSEIHKLALSQSQINLDILSLHLKGLIVVLPIKNNKIFNEVNSKLIPNIDKIRCLSEDFYVGIPFFSVDEHQHINLIKDFLISENISYIPFPDINYLNKDEAIVIDMLSAIKKNVTIEENFLPTSTEEYFKSVTEYNEIFEDASSTFDEFLSKINFEFIKVRGKLISYTENGESDREIFINKVNEGAKKRNIDLTDLRYKNRLNKEFNVIKKMGYINYFLIVQDYINYAKNSNIPVGPGRGSAAGSLISYCLGITEVDPIKYNLLFERFLNIKRKSLPDIDVDISDIRRDEVIDYLVKKYGSNRVSRISAFQTIAAKQALRDVGRIYGKSQQMIGELAKSIPNNFKDEDSKNFSLDYAYQNIPAFKKLVDEIKDYKFIFDRAHLIEGLPRQRGLHAAGILLNDDSLNDIMPLDYDGENFTVAEYEKDYLEEQGFLKMDLLGLSNLTTIAKTLQNVDKNLKIKIKMEDIPYDDAKAISQINSLKVMGIFQLDTAAAYNALINIRPDSFNDIVATISLDRPGPMQFIPSYSRRKHGQEKVTYVSNSLIPILKETYGIIVYQEQIMQIAQVYSGFDFGEADLFRRAISKKHRDEILKMKDSFINGAKAKKHSVSEANTIFEQILKFANYGFNKSHAVSYAMIACKEAYLKANYPIEFYSAILDQQYGSNDVKFSKYLSEIKKSNVKILPPNINESGFVFKSYDNALLIPLLGINGIQSKTVVNIINEREANGPFKSFIDFVIRIIRTKDRINDQQLSRLIDAGAFDIFDKNRKSLKMSIPSAIQYASACAYESALFSDSFGLEFKQVECEDDRLERINNEYEALGVTITDSAISYIKEKANISNITEIAFIKDGVNTSIVGIIRSIKTIVIKNGASKGKPMAFVTIYDDSDEIDCTFFSDIFAKYQLDLDINVALNVFGYKEIKNNRVSFIINDCKVLKE